MEEVPDCQLAKDAEAARQAALAMRPLGVALPAARGVVGLDLEPGLELTAADPAYLVLLDPMDEVADHAERQALDVIRWAAVFESVIAFAVAPETDLGADPEPDLEVVELQAWLHAEQAVALQWRRARVHWAAPQAQPLALRKQAQT